MPYVWASFPAVPGFTCDSWCYESAVDLVSHELSDDGTMVLKHPRSESTAGPLRHYRHARAGCTGVFGPRGRRSGEGRRRKAARPIAELEPLLSTTPGRRIQRASRTPIRSSCDAVSFSPTPVARFSWTLTRRPSLHRFAAGRPPRTTHPGCRCTWASGEWMPGVQGKGWAEYSTDRYTVPVIGTVSRDGKHLVAIANGSADTLCNGLARLPPQQLPSGSPPTPRPVSSVGG